MKLRVLERAPPGGIVTAHFGTMQVPLAKVGLPPSAGREHTLAMKYFAYVSSAKVDQLYDQLTNVAASSIKVKRTRGRKRAGKAEVSMFSALSLGGDVEGESGEEWEMTGNRSTVQKLRSVLAHLEQNADIGDLTAVCRAKARKPLNAFAYLYSGEFVVLGELQRERSHGGSTYGGNISIKCRVAQGSARSFSAVKVSSY